MGDILDPEEIDALMDGLGAKPADASARDTRYDFATQDYAVHRLIPALSIIQGQFAEAFRSRVRTLVPGVESVRSDRIAVMKYDELVRTLPAPCDITLVKAPPLGSPIFLVFESDLVFLLVDHFFGGGGRPLKQRPGGEFSPTEARFMNRLVASLMPDIASSWSSALSIAPEVAERHVDFRFVDALHDSETLLATRFIVNLGGSEATLWSLVPWSAIDGVRDSLGGDLRSSASRQEQDAEWRSRLQAGVEDSMLEVVAVMLENVLPLKRVSRLQVGDILPIESPGEVVLNIGGLPMLGGTFGTHEGQMAVKIERSAGRRPRAR